MSETTLDKPLTPQEAVAGALRHHAMSVPSWGDNNPSLFLKELKQRGYELVAEDTASEWLGCHAGKDGDCAWSHCPQQRDDEPYKTGRPCPLYVAFPDDLDPDDYPTPAPERL